MEPTRYSRRQVFLLGLFTALIMVPVTLPVPVLRGFVQDRFHVSELATSVFMSINMVGAFLAAPVAGALADRFGRRKQLILGAILADAMCFWALTTEIPFWAFMTIRFFEGCAHIFALSLMLSLAAKIARTAGSGRIMGVVGAGISLGVATGAPIGGMLGRHYNALVPVQVGAVLLLAVAVAVALTLEDTQVRTSRPPLADIWRLVRKERALLIPIAYAFTDRFTVGFFTTTFVLFMKRVYELPSDHIGMLLGMFLGPFFLLSYPFGRLSEHVSRTKMIAGGSLLYGIGVCSLGTWSVEALPYLMLTLGCLSAVMFVPSLILTTDLAARDITSTALGAFNAAGSLGFIAGPLVGGYVSSVVASQSNWLMGYGVAFGVAGMSEIVCVLITLPFLRRLIAEGRTT